MTTREIGDLGENFVCDFLKKLGYTICKKNYTIRGGEIDIIAQKDDIIAFVEVKTRQPNPLQTGFEAMTKTKKRNIAKTAQDYYLKSNCNLQPRFDVAVLTVVNSMVKDINYVENAFDLSGMNIYF